MSLLHSIRSHILGSSRLAIVTWTVVSSVVLAFILDVIQSYLWWGRLAPDLLWVGTVDSLIIAAILAPLLVMFIHSIASLEERERSHRQINESDKLYRLLAENISDVIWVRDLHTGRFTYSSPSVERVRGLTVAEALTEDISHQVTPESLKLLQVRIPDRIKALQEGRSGPYVDVVELTRKDSSTFWAEVRTQYRLNPESNHIEVFGVTRDITERKQAEGELLKLRKAISTSSDSIFMTDGSGLITYINPAFTTLYGYEAEELVGKCTPRVLKSGVMSE